MKTILFDFDGTLADTLPICFYAFQKVFQKYDGREITSEEILDMFGPSEVGIIEQNLRNQDQVSQAVEDYYTYYAQEHDNLVKRNPEIEKLLQEIVSSGIQMGIVTGKGRRSYEISVEQLGLKEFFTVSITGDDVIHPKPHPEGIHSAMKMLKATSEETLFVGDSNADIEAGLRANVRTVGVKWLSHTHGQRFMRKPDYEYRKVAKFIEDLLA